jgi:hypothetical protein
MQREVSIRQCWQYGNYSSFLRNDGLVILDSGARSCSSKPVRFGRMYAHFYRDHHRLVVTLVHSHRIRPGAGGARTEFLGRLGSVRLPEPIAAHERERFWHELKFRFAALAGRFPDRISPDDTNKVLSRLAARIGAPTASAERRVLTAFAPAETRRGNNVPVPASVQHQPLRVAS